ncbi:hypothetical protein [Chromobacterium haemolyticum]|uniref:hypothetical protein n=2 Tax=Chromobacteriaceae TaxID=1499392 RepID=UPI004055AA51
MAGLLLSMSGHAQPSAPSETLTGRYELLLIEDRAADVQYVSTLGVSDARMGAIYGAARVGAGAKTLLGWRPPAEFKADEVQSRLGVMPGVFAPRGGKNFFPFTEQAFNRFRQLDLGASLALDVQDKQQAKQAIYRGKAVRAAVLKSAVLRLDPPAGGGSACRDERVNHIDGKLCELRRYAGRGADGMAFNAAGKLKFTVRSTLGEDARNAYYRVGSGAWLSLGQSTGLNAFNGQGGIEVFLPLPKKFPSAEQRERMVERLPKTPERLSQLLEAVFDSSARVDDGFKLSLRDNVMRELQGSPGLRQHSPLRLSRLGVVLIEDAQSGSYVATAHGHDGQALFGEPRALRWRLGEHGANGFKLQSLKLPQGVEGGADPEGGGVILKASSLDGMRARGLGAQVLLGLEGAVDGQRQIWRSNIVKSGQLKLSSPKGEACRQDSVGGQAGLVCVLRQIDSAEGGTDVDGDTRFMVGGRLGSLKALNARYRVGGDWLPLGESVALSRFKSGGKIELFIAKPEQAQIEHWKSLAKGRLKEKNLSEALQQLRDRYISQALEMSFFAAKRPADRFKLDLLWTLPEKFLSLDLAQAKIITGPLHVSDIHVNKLNGESGSFIRNHSQAKITVVFNRPYLLSDFVRGDELILTLNYSASDPKVKVVNNNTWIVQQLSESNELLKVEVQTATGGQESKLILSPLTNAKKLVILHDVGFYPGEKTFAALFKKSNVRPEAKFNVVDSSINGIARISGGDLSKGIDHPQFFYDKGIDKGKLAFQVIVRMADRSAHASLQLRVNVVKIRDVTDVVEFSCNSNDDFTATKHGSGSIVNFKRHQASYAISCKSNVEIKDIVTIKAALEVKASSVAPTYDAQEIKLVISPSQPDGLTLHSNPEDQNKMAVSGLSDIYFDFTVSGNDQRNRVLVSLESLAVNIIPHDKQVDIQDLGNGIYELTLPQHSDSSKKVKYSFTIKDVPFLELGIGGGRSDVGIGLSVSVGAYNQPYRNSLTLLAPRDFKVKPIKRTPSELLLDVFWVRPNYVFISGGKFKFRVESGSELLDLSEAQWSCGGVNPGIEVIDGASIYVNADCSRNLGRLTVPFKKSKKGETVPVTAFLQVGKKEMKINFDSVSWHDARVSVGGFDFILPEKQWNIVLDSASAWGQEPPYHLLVKPTGSAPDSGNVALNVSVQGDTRLQGRFHRSCFLKPVFEFEKVDRKREPVFSYTGSLPYSGATKLTSQFGIPIYLKELNGECGGRTTDLRSIPIDVYQGSVSLKVETVWR